MAGRWDVAIVGSGPAGAAAALRVLQLHPRARVALIDRASFPRDKACGDGIAPHVLDILTELGACDVLDDCPPIPGLRLRAPGGREVARVMRRPTFVLPRLVFDARLATAAARRGASCVQRKVRGIDVDQDRVLPQWPPQAPLRPNAAHHTDDVDASREMVR